MALKSEGKRWWQSATVAHTLPLVLFMLLSSLVGVFRIENSVLPWYQRAPEHWVYPVQCLIVGAVLVFFRRHYSLRPWRGLELAAAFAIIGMVVWDLPASFYREGQPSWYEWLGVTKRDQGFDPYVFAEGSPAWWTTVLLRFFRAVVIVPFVEEIFWRGFLMRYVQADDRDFRLVPFGQHSWKAFWIVTLAVTLVHQPSDYIGAFIWGTLMYRLTVATKSLGACVVMHAIGNLILGIGVMQTRQWGFW